MKREKEGEREKDAGCTHVVGREKKDPNIGIRTVPTHTRMRIYKYNTDTQPYTHTITKTSRNELLYTVNKKCSSLNKKRNVPWKFLLFLCINLFRRFFLSQNFSFLRPDERMRNSFATKWLNAHYLTSNVVGVQNIQSLREEKSSKENELLFSRSCEFDRFVGEQSLSLIHSQVKLQTLLNVLSPFVVNECL